MRNIGLSSAETVKEYIEMLSRAFLGLELLCLNMSTRKAFMKKDKKIYLIDPVIFSVLYDKLRIPLPSESNIVENLIAIHAGRYFLTDWTYTGILKKLYYWKSAKGNEVDFIFFFKEKPFGIEVKYRNTISPWDEMSIKRGIGQGVIVTKNFFEYGKIPKIPV